MAYSDFPPSTVPDLRPARYLKWILRTWLACHAAAFAAASAGTLDPDFGTDGIASIAVTGGTDRGQAVLALPDGKVLVAANLDGGDATVMRLTDDGSLDSSFGDSGNGVADGVPMYVQAMARQSDGSIILVGRASGANGYDFGIARYTGEGLVDTGFGTNGLVATEIGAGYDIAYTVVVGDDDGLVVGGASTDANSQQHLTVARFTAAGVLDTGFGSNGWVTTPIGTYSVAAKVLLDDAGGIIAVGQRSSATGGDAVAVRLSSSGVMDSQFGSGGIAVVEIPDTSESIKGAALQSDGRIVLGGFQTGSGIYDFLVMRLESDGTLDSTFGTGGLTTLSVGTGTDAGYALALQDDGKILLGGYDYATGTKQNMVIIRFDGSGQLDPSFGDSGGAVEIALQYLDGETDEFAFGLDLQGDGKALLAGYHNRTNQISEIVVARFLADEVGEPEISVASSAGPIVSGSETPSVTDGTLVGPVSVDGDPLLLTYTLTNAGTGDLAVDGIELSEGGSSAFVIPDPGLPWTLAPGATDTFTVAFDPVNGGEATTAIEIISNDADENPFTFALSGFAQAGLVSSFAEEGIARIAFGQYGGEARAVVAQSDGKWIVGGWRWDIGAPGLISAAVLLRMDSAGMLDPTFGTDGVVEADFGFDWVAIRDLVIDPATGDLVAAGSGGTNSDYQGAVMRFTADGAIVDSFGTDGIAIVDVSNSRELNGVGVQSDGKIVVTGDLGSGFAVARLLGDGTLDTGFGTTGLAQVAIDAIAEAADLVVLPDDRILLGGSSYDLSIDRAALARFTADGTLDSAFGSSGITSVSVSGRTEVVRSLAIQSGGMGQRIIAAGYRLNANGDSEMAVWGFNSSGILDTLFGTGGSTGLPVGSGGSSLSSIAIQPDDRIAVAGSAANPFGKDTVVARLRVDGGWDTSFGVGGVWQIPVALDNDFAGALAVSADGDVAVAATLENGTHLNTDFALLLVSGADGPTPDLEIRGNGLLVARGSTTPEAGDHTHLGGVLNSGESLQRTFTLENTGAASLTVSGVSLSGPGASDFSVDDLGPFTVAAGSTGVVTITYTAADGVSEATVTVSSDASSGSTYSFAIAGAEVDPGDPDPGFGIDGFVFTNPRTGNDGLRAAAFDRNGGLAVAGTVATEPTPSIWIRRYLRDGTTDSGFHFGGPRIILPEGATFASARALLYDPFENRYLVGGTLTRTDRDFIVAAVLLDGSMDTSFGDGGIVMTDFGTADHVSNGDRLTELLLDSSGNILAVGRSTVGSGSLAVARYLPDGSLDPSFSGDGLVLESLGLESDVGATLTASGDILFTGTVHYGIDRDFLVGRLLSSGLLDATFGTSGSTLLDFGYGNDTAVDLHEDGEGRITIVGMVRGPRIDATGLVRLTADGTIDAGFGDGGQVIVDLGPGFEVVSDSWLQSDGKILLSGAVTGSGPDFTFQSLVARFDPDGFLDPAFGDGGTVIFALQSGGASTQDFADGIAVGDAGVIALVGRQAVAPGNDQMFVSRILSDLVDTPVIRVRGNGLLIADGDSSASAVDGTHFGNVDLDGASRSRSFVISNTGTADFTVSGVDLSGGDTGDFSVTVDSLPVTLSPGNSLGFEVDFDPSEVGSRSSVIAITHDIGDTSGFTFSVAGTGATPVVISAGTNADDSVPDSQSIRFNGTTGQLEVSSDSGTEWAPVGSFETTGTITLTGSGDDDEFVLDFTNGNPIPPGGRIVIVGGGQGSPTGDTLRIEGGASELAEYVFFNPNDGCLFFDGREIAYTGLEPISDTGSATERILTFNGGDETIDITASGSLTTVDSTQGEVITFTNPTERLVIDSGSAADLIRVTSLGSGWTDGATLDLRMGSGDDRAVISRSVAEVAMVEISGGVHVAGDFLYFNDEGDATITDDGELITGDGIYAVAYTGIEGVGVPQPEISVTREGIIIAAGTPTTSEADGTDFGEATVGGSPGIRTFVIGNSGTADLTIDSIEILGTNVTDFDLSAPGLPFTVEPGGTEEIIVTFSPSATGTRIATVSIGSDDADVATFNFAIGGHGIEVIAAVVTAIETAQAYTGAPLSPTITTDPAGLGFALLFFETGAAEPIDGLPVDAGEYEFTVELADPGYSGGILDPRETFIIEKAPQSITFGPLEPVEVGDPDFQLMAVTASQLDITYTGDNDDAATVTPEGLVSIFGEGPVTITASQGGDDNWEPATPVDQVLTIEPLADTDGDGLSDEWETTYFGNITSRDGSGDFDGDGRLDAEEQDDGTDPTNAASTWGLVAFYPFEGDGIDASGSEFHSSVNGPILVDGVIGQAFSFDGVDDGIDLPNAVGDATKPRYSFSAWLKMTGAADHTVMIYHSRGERTFQTYGGNVSWGYNFQESSWMLAETPFPGTDWVHIAGTFDGSSTRMYVDGQLVDTVIPAAATPFDYLSGDASIGYYRPSGGKHYHGLMDEVRFYDRALPQDEVVALFRAVNAAPTGISLDNAIVAENEPAGTPVGSLVAVDPDDTDGLTFALINDFDYPDNDLFEIINGELVTKIELDYETATEHVVRVQVEDDRGGAFATDLVVFVDDVVETIPVDVVASDTTQTYTGSGLFPTITTDPAERAFQILFFEIEAAEPIDGLPVDSGTYEFTVEVTEAGHTGGIDDPRGMFIIEKAPQSITFGPLEPVEVGDPDFQLMAVTASPLDITYAGDNDSAATVTPEGLVSIIGEGTVTITASQAGDNNWEAAVPADQVLTVVSPPFQVELAVSPAGLGEVDGPETVYPGDSITVTASSADGNAFLGWTGDIPAGQESENPLTFTPTSDVSLTAHFQATAELVAVSEPAVGGAVSADAPDSDPANDRYKTVVVVESVVDLMATPLPGFVFDHWEGDVPDGDAMTNPLGLTVDRNLSLVSYFSPLPGSTEGFREWLGVFGGESNPARVGPNADFDGDGRSNFAEYAFVMDAAGGGGPTDPTEQSMTVTEGEDHFLAAGMKVRANDPNVSYFVEVGYEIGSWTRVGLTYDGNSWQADTADIEIVGATNHGDGTWSLQIQDKTATEDEAGRFIRFGASAVE